MNSNDKQSTVLIKRFRKECEDRRLTIEQVCDEAQLSKNTVLKLLNSNDFSCRKDTIYKIEKFLGNDPIANINDDEMFRLLQSKMRVSAEFAQRTIDIYAGRYMTYRFTPSNSGVISSQLEIRNLPGGGARPYFFEKVKVSEFDTLDAQKQIHVFDHKGPVLYREERVYMLSVANGNIRSMIVKAPWSQDFTVLKGLILTVSAGREPYATRVLLRRVSRDLTSRWPEEPNLFRVDDNRVVDILKYIRNDTPGANEPLRII